MQLRPTQEPGRALASVRAMLVLVFAVLVLRHGWMMDDAYITLRTVANVFDGHGLVWNPGERVQSYTHPLWMMLCCAVYGITREFFYSLIVFGALISTASIALVTVRLARSELVGIVLLLAAMLSHAFVDYATSGLENPLTHLLIGLGVWVYLGRLPGRRTFLWLCLIGGLALLSRPDNAVILGPLVIASGVQARRRGATLRELARAALLGALPLLCWELFSLVYYGVLVPNTALAKLNGGVPGGERIEQGLFYLVATLDADPLTLVVIVAGVAAPIWARDRRMLPLAIGIVLHLLYIIEIGGDFMLGRFLTAPMFMALACLSQVRGVPPIPAGIAAAVIATLGLAAHPNTFEINSALTRPKAQARSMRMITDERSFLFESASLVHGARALDMPNHAWSYMGRRGSRPGRRVQVATALGFRAIAGGPEVIWIDRTALSDPLLARLPATYRAQWMSGHYFRALPKGYIDTVDTGDNHISSPAIAELHRRISVVTRGDLWTRERLKMIWWLNTGGPSDLIHEESWRFHGASKRKPSSLRWRVDDGTPRDSKLVRSFRHTGVYVKYKHRHYHRFMELSVNDDDRFEVRFYDGTEEIARVPVSREMEWDEHGVSARRIVLPEVLWERGFTRLRILPKTQRHLEPPAYAIGHLLFDEEIVDAPHVSHRPKSEVIEEDELDTEFEELQELQ